jgi:hypothetical protein
MESVAETIPPRTQQIQIWEFIFVECGVRVKRRGKSPPVRNNFLAGIVVTPEPDKPYLEQDQIRGDS